MKTPYDITDAEAAEAIAYRNQRKATLRGIIAAELERVRSARRYGREAKFGSVHAMLRERLA